MICLFCLALTCTWVVVDEALVDAGQLLGADVAGGIGRGLEIQVVLALDEKFRRSHIHPNHHFVGEAGFFYGRLDQVQRCVGTVEGQLKDTQQEVEEVIVLLRFSLTFAVLLNVGCKASLVSDIGGILAVLLFDDPPQCLVELRPHAQGITERLRPDRKYHKLLHCQPVSSVGSPIDDIESLKGRAQGDRDEIVLGV